MVIADVTATGDDNVLSAKANDVSYRKEQLRRLQEEVIELEDLKTGVSITDLGLNEFRMDLLSHLKESDDLTGLPNGMHAVLPAAPAKGLPAGVIFALRNRNHGINVNQQNRLHPYYLIYVGKDGRVVSNHMEVKRILDLLRANCVSRTEPVHEPCRIFNRQTNDGKDMQAYSMLLGEAIRSVIHLKDDKDLDSLFSGKRTSALVDKISGLDDFELIAFIVVQDAN
jgi:hypothetical protein